jgi:3-oxoacyl-[acyl-carrier protein] reductase
MKHIIITGGNSGIGCAIAEAFLQQHDAVKIWLGMRSNRDRAETLLAQFPQQIEMLDLDVTSADDWQKAVQEINAPIAVLVNNAGKHDDHLLANMNDNSWHEVIDINLNSAYYGSKAVLPSMMRERFGRIINISSLSAILPRIGQVNYAAAKAGLNAMTQALSKEVARMGITVNAIMPGFIETEALNSLPDEAKSQAKKEIPMRRFGKASEVAAAVRFLASDDAAYITGSILKIDGGIF